MGIFSSSKNEELVAIFDIGSASVSGALVRMPADSKISSKPTIVYTTTVELELSDDLSFDKFLNVMQESVATVARLLKDIKLGAPKKAFCFMASPWYASQIRVMKLSKNAPFLFTEKLSTELINKEITSFEAVDLKKFGDPGNLKLLETKNIEIKLNGYQTETPFGKKAREIELTAFFSVSPKIVIERVEHAIEKSFTLPAINFLSFLFSSFVVSRNLFAHDHNFLLLDIGGEVTDVSIIKNTNLVESVSFPPGKNFILRRIATQLGKTPAEIRSLIALFLGGGMEEAAKAALQPIFTQAKKDWLSAFQQALFSISDELSVPEQVFVTVDEDIASWFVEVIQAEEFSQHVLSEKKFNVILIGPAVLHDFCTSGDRVVRNPFIMLESIFIHTLTKK